MASSYPTAIDGANNLLVPADRTPTRTLETSLTAGILSGSTTIQVADAITPGFPAAYGVLVIGAEQIIYAGRTSTTFTGCIRGANGSTAAAHASGAVVRALFTSAFLYELQAAVIAIQTALGITGAFNFAPTSHAHSAFGGASSGSAGSAGFVPAPAAGDEAKVLRGDGSWAAGGGGGASAAVDVTFSPVGNIAATNVQAALQELDGEKAGTGHTHAASVISVGASGAMPAGNAQERLQELWANKADKSIVISAGAGMGGGGDLSANRSLTANVRLVHGRDGDVVAAAGDYNATQVNATGSGWMSGATVQQLIDAIKARIDALESNLGSNYYTKSVVDSGLNGKASSVHVHNETGTTTTGPIG